MKRHTMPNKYLLPPILSEKELEEWNEKVREAFSYEVDNDEIDEVIKKLFKLEKQRKK